MSTKETRRWPDGKLCPDDHGELGLAIAHHNGQVIVRFPTAVRWIGMPPNQAREFAKAILTHAIQVEAEGGRK